ncbi:MAG TPA: hypothetical protein VMM38_14730 [Aridibacter sp.]|nr:hypothetical protein [Aridibacter sp.]
MALILIASVLLMIGCGPGAGHSTESRTYTEHPETPATYEGRKDEKIPKQTTFKRADGIVVFDGTGEELEKAEWKVVIYGEDGKPWRIIDQRDDSIDSLEGESGDFFPIDFSNGNKRDFLIEMRLTGRSEDWLEVVAHESRTPPVKAYVRVRDPLFKELSWEEWVLGHFNLRFDQETNPLLESPDGAPKEAVFPETPLIKPDNVGGDWVLVRWTQHEPDEPSVEWLKKNLPENSGWIRWRKDGKILISDYYP